MNRNARAGIPVLGTVAHFLPTLSMTKPAGKIIANTDRPEMVNKNPTSLGVNPSWDVAYSGSMLWVVTRWIMLVKGRKHQNNICRLEFRIYLVKKIFHAAQAFRKGLTLRIFRAL